MVPVVDASPVGIYLDILFNGFSGNVAAINNAGAGVAPQSPNIDIAYGALDVDTIEEGTPEMTVVYQDTTVNFFDLTYFYFGCVIGLENRQADLVESCTVTATCVNPAGVTVATQNFPFVSNGGVLQNMVQAKPNGFKGCEFVKFATTSLGGATTATALDTISYTVYSKLPLSPK